MIEVLGKIKIWRLLMITCLTCLIGLYLFKPIYLTNPFKLGFICKVCNLGSINQFVAIKLAGESVTTLAKILAKPGDIVQITNGLLSINQTVSELVLPKNFNYSQRTNKELEYFVVIYDHNLETIIDYGRVQQSRIIGKVILP